MAGNKSMTNVLEIVMASSEKSVSSQKTSLIKKAVCEKLPQRFIHPIWRTILRILLREIYSTSLVNCILKQSSAIDPLLNSSLQIQRKYS